MMLDDKCFRIIDSNCWDPEIRLKEMARDNKDKQVISTVPIMFNYWAKPNDTEDLCKFLNNHIFEVTSKNKKSFIGLGTVPMQSSSHAIKELERCIHELKFPGIQIGSCINGKNLDDPSLFDFYAAAEDLEASLLVHPWDMLGKDRMEKHWTPWLVGMPAETSLAIVSCMLGGIFEKYPKLKICFCHGGGALPYTLGRINHAYNVRPDLCATNSTISPNDLIGRFWVDSIVHDEKTLKFLIDVIGSNNVVLGSDYPFPLGELRPGTLLKNSTLLNTKEKNNIRHHSVLNFLGLNK